MIKVKAAMDEFIEGLKTLGIHDAVSFYPQLISFTVLEIFVEVSPMFCKYLQLHYLLIPDDIRSLVKVKVSVNATAAEKDFEEQAFLQFEQFLTDADGMLDTFFSPYYCFLFSVLQMENYRLLF